MNIAEILRTKPHKTKFYSLLHGTLTLESISNDDNSINAKNKYGIDVRFRGNGHYYNDYNNEGECLLFSSKEMRDWNKFAWKKGDILVGQNGDMIIFTEWSNDSYTLFNGIYHQCFDGGVNYGKAEKIKTKYFSKACVEQCQLYIAHIENYYGGKLNLSTLKIEKPQFKDGDIICMGGSYNHILIYKRREGSFIYYHAMRTMNDKIIADDYIVDCKDNTLPPDRPATDSEKQQLFNALEKEGKRWNPETKTLEDLPKKYEFKVFDKVLVRDDLNNHWRPAFFYKYNYDNDCPYTMVGGEDYSECIPYNDQTAHLLGTIDDWKGGER